MLYPLTFQSIFKERVWGGRKLEELYHKPLPTSVPIGESWEVGDRPGDVNVIANGPLAGKDLHWLVENHPAELLGPAKTHQGRFPLLIKILDAQEKLSLQVHPPPDVAVELGGEPKTELWYITDAAPGAELYVGLKRGVTREEFQRKIHDGSVAECFHRISVRPGDAMFLPSGRVHSIGAGLVLFEVQENSDTTYRVFDWNRVGLDGKPRALHVQQSLASINFEDFEPPLLPRDSTKAGPLRRRPLINDPLFKIDVFASATGGSMLLSHGNLMVIAVERGRLVVASDVASVELSPGQFCLVPAGVKAEVWVKAESSFLLVQSGDNSA